MPRCSLLHGQSLSAPGHCHPQGCPKRWAGQHSPFQSPKSQNRSHFRVRLGFRGSWDVASSLLPQVSKLTHGAYVAFRLGLTKPSRVFSRPRLPAAGPCQPAGPRRLGSDKQQHPDPWTLAQARPAQAWECSSPSSQKLFSDTGCRKRNVLLEGSEGLPEEKKKNFAPAFPFPSDCTSSRWDSSPVCSISQQHLGPEQQGVPFDCCSFWLL